MSRQHRHWLFSGVGWRLTSSVVLSLDSLNHNFVVPMQWLPSFRTLSNRSCYLPTYLLTVPYGLCKFLKTKKTQKNQNWYKHFPGHEYMESQFSVERAKIKGQGHQMSKTSTAIWHHGWPIKHRGSGTNCKLGDLIHCQRLTRLATEQTTAYHVGTRHQHLFLSCPALNVNVSLAPIKCTPNKI